MSVWVENSRVYSDALDAEKASCEIDRHAYEQSLELSHEYLAKSELRGEKQVYLKHILSKQTQKLS